MRFCWTYSEAQRANDLEVTSCAKKKEVPFGIGKMNRLNQCACADTVLLLRWSTRSLAEIRDIVYPFRASTTALAWTIQNQKNSTNSSYEIENKFRGQINFRKTAKSAGWSGFKGY